MESRGAAEEELRGGPDAKAEKTADEMTDEAVNYRFGWNGVEADGKRSKEILKAVARGGDAHGQVMLASSYESGCTGFKEDSAKARKWYGRAAEQDYCPAIIWLGNRAFRGEGVEQDLEEGARYYRRAAELGSADGQRKLANCYSNGLGVEQDYEEAVQWNRLAAQQEDFEAMLNLAFHYAEGSGVDQDNAEALRLFHLLAEEGDCVAQLHLFFCYKEGWLGLEPNDADALRLLRQAADQGYPEAQYQMGMCYHQGLLGLEENDEDAFRWFQLAADQGDPQAQYVLGLSHTHGIGTGVNRAEGARFIRLSAENGHSPAQVSLAAMLAVGIGVLKNLEESVRWYRLAADQGNASAQASLGERYAEGRGVAQDFAEAARLFQLGADQDDVDAQMGLGELFFEGKGVERNCDMALHWFNRAREVCEEEGGNMTVVSGITSPMISEIEKAAAGLLERPVASQRALIEAGESVFGQTKDEFGDFALHVAARQLHAETIAMLFDHPSFDDLVLRENAAGELPRDIVGHGDPALANSREARALRSILSVSRQSRAACVLWCFEALRNGAVAPERLIARLPNDLVREIVRRVLSPPAPGGLRCGVLTLMNSPTAWPRPCLALAPPVVPQQQQQQQSHQDLTQPVSTAQVQPGVLRERGEKRSSASSRGAAAAGSDEDEPANKRRRH